MSNNKSSIQINQIKSDKEKYILFNEFLKNLLKENSKGYSPESYTKKDCFLSNKINLSKYTKIDGSKNFLLDSTNSIPLKEDLNENLDKVKSIINNLDFLSSNTKYINTFQYLPNSIPKKYKQNKNVFMACQQNILQKNLFMINRKLNPLNPYEIKDINDSKENKNEFNISDNGNNNTLEDDDENLQIKETIKLNKNQDLNLKHQSSYRQDYYVKQFKVQYSIWIRNYLNQKLKELISETKSCRRHLKFYPLNSLKFTANPKYEDNKYFLSLKIKEILIVGINSIKSSNQRKNKENIEIIENNIYKHNDNANKELLNFLNSTMEDSMKIFYQSEQFEKFKNNKQTKLNDANFVQEKNFSLLKENGFVYLIKNYKGNSKTASSITFLNTSNK